MKVFMIFNIIVMVGFAIGSIICLKFIFDIIQYNIDKIINRD